MISDEVRLARQRRVKHSFLGSKQRNFGRGTGNLRDTPPAIHPTRSIQSGCEAAPSGCKRHSDETGAPSPGGAVRDRGTLWVDNNERHAWAGLTKCWNH